MYCTCAYCIDGLDNSNLKSEVRFLHTGAKARLQSASVAAQVAEALQEAGAAAVCIHGRTMEQRYKKAADWSLVQQAATTLSVPVIGNGDVLTHYEVNIPIKPNGSQAVCFCCQVSCCVDTIRQPGLRLKHPISAWSVLRPIQRAGALEHLL